MGEQAKRDNNSVVSTLGTSTADGISTKAMTANPTTHRLSVDLGMDTTDLSGDEAPRDQNSVTSLLGVSNSGGTTTVPVYAHPGNGRILLKST